MQEYTTLPPLTNQSPTKQSKFPKP